MNVHEAITAITRKLPLTTSVEIHLEAGFMNIYLRDGDNKIHVESDQRTEAICNLSEKFITALAMDMDKEVDEEDETLIAVKNVLRGLDLALVTTISTAEIAKLEELRERLIAEYGE